VVSGLDPAELENSFVAWGGSIAKLTAGEVVAIDGKALCGTRVAGPQQAGAYGFSLGQRQQSGAGPAQSGGKSNEITAIPKLLQQL
jgi:hypothetical protein